MHTFAVFLSDSSRSKQVLFSVCSINGYQLVNLAVRPVVASLLFTFTFHLLHSLTVLLLHILKTNEKPVVI